MGDSTTRMLFHEAVMLLGPHARQTEMQGVDYEAYDVANEGRYFRPTFLYLTILWLALFHLCRTLPFT